MSQQDHKKNKRLHETVESLSPSIEQMKYCKICGRMLSKDHHCGEQTLEDALAQVDVMSHREAFTVSEEEVREVIGSCGGHKWIAERITELLQRKYAAATQSPTSSIPARGTEGGITQSTGAPPNGTPPVWVADCPSCGSAVHVHNTGCKLAGAIATTGEASQPLQAAASPGSEREER